METVSSGKARIAAVARGLFCACAATVLFLVVLALLLYKMELDEGKLAVGIIVTYIVSGFLGGWMAGRHIQSRKFLWGMAAGGAYFAVLLVISLAGGGGSLSGVRVLTTLCMCLGGGMLGGMLS